MYFAVLAARGVSKPSSFKNLTDAASRKCLCICLGAVDGCATRRLKFSGFLRSSMYGHYPWRFLRCNCSAKRIRGQKWQMGPQNNGRREHRMAEDSFERARKAFFGNGKSAPGPNVAPGESSAPPNEPIQSKDGRAGAAALSQDLRTRA